MTETYLAHLLSPFVRMNSIHHLWMIFMDYVLQMWLGRSKPFCRFLFAFFYFCLHSSTTETKERSGPLAFSPPALSGSSKHLLIILLHSGSTTRVLSVCVWQGEKNNVPSGYLLPDLTNQFQWRDSLRQWDWKKPCGPPTLKSMSARTEYLLRQHTQPLGVM